jgi:hypothetical protein
VRHVEAKNENVEDGEDRVERCKPEGIGDADVIYHCQTDAKDVIVVQISRPEELLEKVSHAETQTDLEEVLQTER